MVQALRGQLSLPDTCLAVAYGQAGLGFVDFVWFSSSVPGPCIPGPLVMPLCSYQIHFYSSFKSQLNSSPKGCLVEGHSAASGAGGQEALGLGVLALRVLPPQFGVCEESQERVGPRWAEPGAGRLWAGLWQGKERGGGGAPTDRQGPRGCGRALAHPLTHSLAQHAPVSTYAWALRKQR